MKWSEVLAWRIEFLSLKNSSQPGPPIFLRVNYACHPKRKGRPCLAVFLLSPCHCSGHQGKSRAEAVHLVIFKVAFVAAAIRPSLRAVAVHPAIFKVAFVTVAISPSQRWPRWFGQNLLILKWCLAKVGLSTALLAAPFAEQERAARWVTRSSIYAACCSAGRC